MRKLLLVAFATFAFLCTHAQLTDENIAIAKAVVAKNRTAIGLSPEEFNNTVVSSTYLSEEGIRMVYLYQGYKGIPVYNQMYVLAFKNDKLVSAVGKGIPSLDQKVNVKSGTPGITVQDAVRSAFLESKIDLQSFRGNLANPVTNEWRRLDFGNLGVSDLNVTAELMWVPVGDKEVKLAWQIFVAPLHSSDMWQIRINALDGSVIGKDNLTVYDHWSLDKHAVSNTARKPHLDETNYVTARSNSLGSFKGYKLPVVNSATYRVVKYPAESPIHPGGAPSLHTDPWTMSPGNATTLKWHSDGTIEHDSTWGNNVIAAEDRNNTNTVIDKAAVSQTPQPSLTFDYVPDFTQSPLLTTPPNQQFNITNLFYMNNIMHDITYLYGFNEVSGNFQKNNLGRGGLGNDHVFADAQDGGGTNNANFGTPADGSNPRMQMYIWTAANPDRDGDVDNGIIAHEFGHGISNRLTGGPANSGCVGNAEHGGEGWSDYYALMLTTNWATATVTDGALPRPIGTYSVNQPITGGGIRNFPYSTNMAVNPLVYSTTLPTQVHNRGEYWCMALWEMTWAMIQQNGINPNLFNPAGVGGNSAAIKLVTEGMKLQPCGPGFIDARDAILKADTLFFGAQYSCAIWTAFAKRGMGRGASQGSAGSVTDQVPSFVVSAGVTGLNENVSSQQEGGSVTYTNKVTVDNCAAITGYYVTDTLPTNVTYVSGGVYNAGNRTVSFNPINLPAGAVQTYPFTVTVNAGTYFTPVTHFNEQVTGGTIPASWAASSINATAWSVATGIGHSLPNAFAALYNINAANDLSLATAASFTLNPNTVSNYSTLSFWHQYNTEEGWDGGVVEISTNNGSTWTDLGPLMIKNKYNGSLGAGSNLANRSAFTGTTSGFIETVINLSAYAGQPVRIRFRFGSDNNTGATSGTSGWWVDDIVLYSEPAIQMRSNLFNSSNVRMSFSDTLTRITLGCATATITSQPANANGCVGGNATFSVVTSGGSGTYQWQVNTGSGFADITNAPPYSGATTATLTITNITAGMAGYQYRCVVGNACTPSFNSGSATLSVGAVATLNSHPSDLNVCPAVTVNFSVTATNPAGYQWQINTGSGFTNLSNTAPYSGVNTATLTITGTTVAMNNHQFRCVVGSCPSSLTSNAATLLVAAPINVTAQPTDVTACEGAGANFAVTVTGTVISYQWQISTDGGVTYTNIGGANTSSYSLVSLLPPQSGSRFRCVITGVCGASTSNVALLTVNALPNFTLGTIPPIACVSDPAIALTASVSGGVWSGSGVSGSVFTPSAAGTGIKTITYTLTNLGCSRSQSTVIQVNECAERHRILTDPYAVFIYPNPNTGKFSIRMNTDLYKNLGLKVFASEGKELRTYFFNGLSFGSVIPMDLTSLPNGTYHLYLYNEENGFIKKGVSIVIYKK